MEVISILRKKPAYAAEIVGLLLVLLSIGSQVFLEDVVKDIAQGTALLKIHEKLDIMWRHVGHTEIEVEKLRQGNPNPPSSRSPGGAEKVITLILIAGTRLNLKESV